MSERSMHGRMGKNSQGWTNRFQFECLEDRRLLSATQFFDINTPEVACHDFPESKQADYAVDSEIVSRTLESGNPYHPNQLASGDGLELTARGYDDARTHDLGLSQGATNGMAQQNVDAEDIAGATFQTAYEIGELKGRVVLSDSVAADDRVDMFSFQLVEDSSIGIDLDGLTDDADLFLYNEKQQYVSHSVNSQAMSEEITENLNAGEYFVVIFAKEGTSTDYDVQFSASPKTAQDAGDFYSSSFDLGVLDSAALINETVGGNDPRDFYRFTIEQDSKVSVAVTNLSANVTLLIYDIDKNLIVKSSNSRLNDELANFEVDAGDYYVRVNQAKGFVTDYRLDIEISPADGRFEDVAYYGSSNEWNLNSMNAPEVWAAGFHGDGVTVAVIDTGVDYEHSDLVDSLWVNAGEVAGNGIDDDGNGFVDDFYGWDFVDSDALPLDEHGHGTHVAGTIGAARNGFGVTGVAYGSSIMSIRVLDEDGSGFYSDVAAGIYYAVDNGADVINLSLGGPPASGLFSALAYAESNGVFVVASAGNESSTVPTYPASYSSSLTNVISVGAYDSSQSIASFSNHVGGSGAIQVDAPGVSIASTFSNNRYARMSGTSMAAPHVAGLAALIIDANRSLDPQAVREIIVSGAVDSIANSDSRGGIDAARSVYIAANSGGSQSLESLDPNIAGRRASNGNATRLNQPLHHADGICRINVASEIAETAPFSQNENTGFVSVQDAAVKRQLTTHSFDRNLNSDLQGFEMQLIARQGPPIDEFSSLSDESFDKTFKSGPTDVGDVFTNRSIYDFADELVAKNIDLQLQLQSVDDCFETEAWL